MSSPDAASPPDPLQDTTLQAADTDRGSSLLPWGGSAARIRAAVREDVLPSERADADALVMTAWLTADQRQRYLEGLRARDDSEDFARTLADERRVVLEEGADPVPDELESARAAEKAARQIPLRLLEATLLVGGSALLAWTGLRIWQGTLAPRTEPSALALTVGIALVLVIIAAVVGVVATRRRDRQLLDWAVSRPGQLGRGLPLRRPLQGESVGPAIVRGLGPALLVVAGVLGIVAGAAVLLIVLLSREGENLVTMSIWSLVGGALAVICAALMSYLRARRLWTIARRTRAAQWIGAAPAVEDSDGI